MPWSDYEGVTWDELAHAVWRALQRSWGGYTDLTWDDLEGIPWWLVERGVGRAWWSDYATYTWDDLRRYTWNAVRAGVPRPTHAGPLDMQVSTFGQIMTVSNRLMTVEVTSVSVSPLNVASPLVTTVLDDHQDLEVFEVIDIYA